MGSLNTFIGEASATITLSGGSGGGGISFPPDVLAGEVRTFTLPGDTDTLFTWTPQMSLSEFTVELIGGGGGGGGGSGRSSKNSTTVDKVTTTNSQATAASGGGGSGAAYTRRTYNMQALQGNVDFTMNVPAAVAGGAGINNGFANTSPAGGTNFAGGGTGGGSSIMTATVGGADTSFITAGGGFGGDGSESRLTAIGFGCGAQLGSTAGAAQSNVGIVSIAALTGLTLVGTAIDESGDGGLIGQASCAAIIGSADDVTANSGFTDGGSGGQAGGTEAQMTTIAGATTVSTGTGVGAGVNGNPYGAGGAGGRSETQGSNTNADADTTSVITLQSGGSGAAGICRLTFVWSGTEDDQPKDSTGTVIVPD